MKLLLIGIMCALLCYYSISSASIGDSEGETSVTFGFRTENGQKRSENIKYNMTDNSLDKKNKDAKPVEYKGGYSFISADGYEYSVQYKANKNGFQPYVTAKKIVQKD